MQKKLIALAIAGLASTGAFAQTNVTMYGILEVGYNNLDIDYKNNAGVKASLNNTATGFDQGALTSNRLGFKGSEDLGGGLKANFNYEFQVIGSSSTAYGANQAAPFSTRHSWVSLSNAKWGEVKLGKQWHVAEDVSSIGLVGGKTNTLGSLYNANATTVGGFAEAVAVVMNPPRISDAVTYLSPNMGGFTFAAQYAKNDGEADTSTAGVTTARADTNTTHWGVNAIYANGPLSVGVTYWDAETDTKALTAAGSGSTRNQDQWNLAANYNFGVAKVWGLYVAGDDDTSLIGALNADESDGWELGLSVPMGAWNFWGSYAQADRSASANPAAGVARVKEKLDYNAWQLGATYSFSKRTTAYLQYGDVEIDGKVKAVAFKESANADQLSVGLRHSF